MNAIKPTLKSQPMQSVQSVMQKIALLCLRIALHAICNQAGSVTSVMQFGTSSMFLYPSVQSKLTFVLYFVRQCNCIFWLNIHRTIPHQSTVQKVQKSAKEQQLYYRVEKLLATINAISGGSGWEKSPGINIHTTGGILTDNMVFSIYQHWNHHHHHHHKNHHHHHHHIIIIVIIIIIIIHNDDQDKILLVNWRRRLTENPDRLRPTRLSNPTALHSAQIPKVLARNTKLL